MIIEKKLLKKKPKPNRIKQIGLDSFPLTAHAIVYQVATALGLKIREDKNEKGNVIGISTYVGNCLRLADHCTYLQTWVDAGTWNAPYRYDVVIKDKPSTAKLQVKDGYDFEVKEFVTNAEQMDIEKVKLLAFDIKNFIDTGVYANNIRGEKILLQSNHISDEIETKEENNKTNKNKNMKKNVIRLNEAQLKKIVAESVKKVLKNITPPF